MNARGFTLPELLVAIAVGAVVLLGVGSFYVSSVRFSAASQSQAYLQERAGFIVEEMSRQIRPATVNMTTGCRAGETSLGVTNSAGTFCFYRVAATDRFFRDSPGPATFDLLSGLPGVAALRVTAFTLCLTTPPDATCAAGGTAARITFELRDTRANSMTFVTSIARLNN
jgi:prepilin-type N-terminal cleavage/methylation domain-containing protein